MEFFDLFWDLAQDSQLGELRSSVERLEGERRLDDGDYRTTKELAAENLELKLRLGLLVRLLVMKNVITAEEYAKLLAEARSKRPARLIDE